MSESQQPVHQQYPYWAQPIPPAAPPPVAHHPALSWRRTAAAAGLGALVAGGAVFAVEQSLGDGSVAGSGSVTRTVPQAPAGQAPAGGDGAAAQTSYGTATAAQQVGVVDIDTVLGYSGGRAAGTGMVLTSNGEILTNNHVVRGATAITVTVVTTGRSYPATVVGTDPSDDVAVLRLKDASGLQTVKLGDAADLKVGDTVTGVGNAGGVGGTPNAATGSVVALERTITAADEDGSNPETLDGMIQTDAAIQAGDSGGPLYDAQGEVVGMDTAASTSATAGFPGSPAAATAEGYAIPIEDALAVAKQIGSGQESNTVHIGYPAFLGVSVAGSTDTGGVLVGGVVTGGPAAGAGIVAGDVITAIDGTRLASAASLQAALAAHEPGGRVTVTWTDASGTSHRATVTLATGAAD